MKHAEKVTLIAAALTSLATLVCCLPMGFAAVAATASLSIAAGSTPSRVRDASRADLVFLTREGCANTAARRRNVDSALKSLGLASRYEVIYQDTLAKGDIRRGYPTPTLLYADRDVFGLPVPKPPLPEPS